MTYWGDPEASRTKWPERRCRRSWLYSDSPADEPLFEAVGHPVVVNPRPPFRAEAERRGWPVVAWADRSRPGTDGEGEGADEWGSWDG